jgi:hypothetical protein
LATLAIAEPLSVRMSAMLKGTRVFLFAVVISYLLTRITTDHKPDHPKERQRLEAMGATITQHTLRSGMGLFVCLFVCIFVCLFVCLFDCLFEIPFTFNFVLSNFGGKDMFRLEGILGLSRAFGDFQIEPYITSDPDVFVIPSSDLDSGIFTFQFLCICAMQFIIIRFSRA